MRQVESTVITYSECHSHRPGSGPFSAIKSSAPTGRRDAVSATYINYNSSHNRIAKWSCMYFKSYRAMTVGRWLTTEKTRGNGSPSGSLGWATAPPTARDPTNPTFTLGQPLRRLDLQPDNDDDNQAYTTTTEDPNIFSCKYLTD